MEERKKKGFFSWILGRASKPAPEKRKRRSRSRSSLLAELEKHEEGIRLHEEMLRALSKELEEKRSKRDLGPLLEFKRKLEEKKAILDKRQVVLQAELKKVHDVERLLGSKEKKIEKKESALETLMQKEARLASAQGSLAKRIEELRSQERLLQKKLKAKTKFLDTLDKDILTKKGIEKGKDWRKTLLALEKTLRRRERALLRREEKLAKRAQELSVKEADVKKKVDSLADLKRQVDELKAQREELSAQIKALREQMAVLEDGSTDRKDVLDAREEELVQHELEHALHEKKIKALLDTLLVQRNRLQEEVSANRKAIEVFSEEWNRKTDQLSKARGQVKEEKKKLKALIKKEMGALAARRKEIKAEAGALASKKGELARRENDLGHRQASLKKELAALERKKRLLAAREAVLARGKDKKRKPRKKEVMVPLFNRRARRKGDDDALVEGVKAVKQDDIPDILREARLLLNSGQVRAAERVIRSLELAYRKMKQGEKKADLRYKLMDLKTSLKLARIV